nr:PREDICTED: nucleoporin nup211 [Bemisia tabaci]
MFLHQKQKQDIIMFKIMEEILRLESAHKEMYQKAEIKKSELHEIRLEIAEGVADTEVVQTQNKRMLQFWNRMLIEIQLKNKTVAQVQAALRAAEGQFSGLHAQIDSYAKDSIKELKLSQELTQKHNKISEVFSKLQRETIELIESCQKRDSEFKNISGRNQAVRRNLEQVFSGKKSKKGLLLTCHQKIQRLKDVKFQLQEEILRLLQNKAVRNTSIVNLQKEILGISQKIRKQESYSAKLENDLRKITLEMEIEKGSLTLTRKALEEMRKDCESKESEFHQLETKLKKTKDGIKISSLRCEEQSKTLEILREYNKKTSGCLEEEKLKCLKSAITEMQKKTDCLKQSWLRKQNEIVHFAQERTRQVHQYNMLKKQVLILEQKNWKLNYHLEMNQNHKRKIERTIKRLLLRIENLNAESHKYNTQIQTFDAANHITHKEYSGELKDAEEEMLGLTKDIDDLETKKEEMSEDVLILEQEFLTWEKKCKMMTEARQKILEEQAAEGEIGTMKAEIHRMKETKSLEKDCLATETKREELQKEWKAKQDQLTALKLTTSQMEDQLQEGQFHKQKNLELLVRKQYKGRLYAAIKANKYQLLFAHEASLQIELQRQITMNLDLVSVVECLLVDFPPLTNPINRILNVLRMTCL